MAFREDPEYRLVVSHRGITEIDTSISEMHAQVIALIAIVGGDYCQKNPQHVPFVMGTIARTIEEAMQLDLSAHATWLDLCENYEETIRVDLKALTSSIYSEPVNPFTGGIGGCGRWFGAGGGGGGPGLFEGGAGGPGAGGAGFLFHIADDDSGVDINALVTPQTSQTRIWPDSQRIEVVAIGGGGAGGPGGCLIDLTTLKLPD